VRRTSGPRTFLAAVIAVCIGAWLASCAVVRAGDRDALWKIVHGQCVPNERATGSPTPCLAVDLARGYAVLKDLHGRTQVLVIPTARITGIESPAVLTVAAPNYWQDAWASRRFVEKLAGRAIPRDDIALAVNSADGRTQDQLHVHVDCVRADVKAALAVSSKAIGPRWAPLPIDLAGRRYQALRLAGADLGARNPFKLLAAADAAAKANMGQETLAVVAVNLPDGSPGFVALADRANPLLGDHASSASLLDHDCKVLAAAKP
jgi:CDP-diacylglycerol pyrophosphatase